MIYLSGPMLHYQDNNLEAFKQAAATLHERYGTDISIIIPSPPTITFNRISNIKKLSYCDTIFMLKNWMDSPIATLEKSIAEYLDIKVMFE